jgi:hypothetical protein
LFATVDNKNPIALRNEAKEHPIREDVDADAIGAIMKMKRGFKMHYATDRHRKHAPVKRAVDCPGVTPLDICSQPTLLERAWLKSTLNPKKNQEEAERNQQDSIDADPRRGTIIQPMTKPRAAQYIPWFVLLPAYVLLHAITPPHPDRLAASTFNYMHRPAGYHWQARRDPGSGNIVYYGIDSITKRTVYVGPDNAYYAFPHPPPITPGDLRSTWLPHDEQS